MYKSLYIGKRRRSRQKNILLLRLFQIGKLKKKSRKDYLLENRENRIFTRHWEPGAPVGTYAILKNATTFEKKMKDVIYLFSQRENEN